MAELGKRLVSHPVLFASALSALAIGAAVAQYGPSNGGFGGGFGGGRFQGGYSGGYSGGFSGGFSGGYDNGVYDNPPPREIFPSDSFTFCRIIFDEGDGDGAGWWVDTPDADTNLSLRLSQTTTIRINHAADGRIQRVDMRLTDPELFKYPIAFVTEPGAMSLSDDEQAAMRSYLLRGGFLIFDDFHGDIAWSAFARQMDRVLPASEYPIVDIPLSHQIFHMVFDIKEIPQIPVVVDYPTWLATGDAVEWGRGHSYASGDTRPHCRGIFDKKNRLMCAINFNTDLGDSWQQEGHDEGYFRDFSARRGFPMGINMITYAMTH